MSEEPLHSMSASDADAGHGGGGASGGGGGHRSGGHAAGHGGGDHDEEGHEGAPEWLISFADNTALMMGFFVILLALNMGPKGGGSGEPGAAGAEPTAQELDWVLSIRRAFNNPVDINSTNPAEGALVRRLRQKMQNAEDEGPLGRHDKVQSLQRGEHFAVTGEVLFSVFSSELTGESRQSLARVVDEVRGINNIVEIRAHNSTQENTPQTDYGLRLCYQRAVAVETELIRLGLRREQLRIVLCGDRERITYRAYSESLGQANQRVEVIMTNELSAE